MKRLFSLLSLGFIPALPAYVASAPLEDLIAAAKKEGVIELLAPSTMGAKGAQAMGDAFNKKHGLNVKMNYSSSSNMTGDLAKVVMGAASNTTPEWDLMVVTDAHHATMWRRKLHRPLDYAKVGVPLDLIHYDKGTITLANQFILPASNKNILPASDVPKRWEDLLNPKWRGGKLGMSTATHHLSRLASHSNVGHLFALFLTALEAQTIWEQYNGQTSAFIPGTSAYKYTQGKRILFMTQNQADTVDRLARDYGKILGFES
jgi:spermidine/putrescine-binding protein